MSWRAGGIRPWIVQRLTAVMLAVVLLVFVLTLMISAPENYAQWRALMGGGFWNTVIIVFWVSLIAHAWIGIRDVIMDYVHPDGLRFGVLAVFGFFFIAMMIWMFKIMVLATS